MPSRFGHDLVVFLLRLCTDLSERVEGPLCFGWYEGGGVCAPDRFGCDSREDVLFEDVVLLGRDAAPVGLPVLGVDSGPLPDLEAAVLRLCRCRRNSRRVSLPGPSFFGSATFPPSTCSLSTSYPTA